MTQPQYDDTSDQIAVRKEKRQRMLAEGRDPYPPELTVTHAIEQIRAGYVVADGGDTAGDGEAAGNGVDADVTVLQPGDELTDVTVAIAGRVMLFRPSGKIAFVQLQAGAGERIQVIFSLANVGKEALDALKADVDLGDHVFVEGYVGASKRGELSVFATSWKMASKAIRPLPKTFTAEDGTEMSLNEETRVRNRHLDLITRADARNIVRIRAKMMKSIRKTFDERGYVEVETPILQPLHGGAAARPFETHINAYDQDLYLRIATELYLKRAVVGGLERVYEIGKNFRNEGADSTHSPEFSAMEAYQAYATYEEMATLTRDLIQNAARDIFGTTTVTLADGTDYDLGGEWTRLDLYESLSEAVGEEVTVETPRERLVELAEAHDIPVKDYAVNGKIAEDIWEELVGDHLWAPTFVFDFPEDTSPLTRNHRSKPGLTEKWDLYVRGVEVATAYTELADPVIQRERLTQQSLDAAAGDPEAMQLDEAFIEAMEQGFPPSGGMGMGIDRMLMVLTGLGIRETILFPFVRPQARK
ncbi:lysine--tRNA ligase [Trueperella bialowiezensis]|uniref:Lysine--tRNA ligase n=1 Tax=Trueperella bialowiezensis TaxID=312285 RepID=A0A3S4V7F1_9ACTO|nr:lysine--tRNA ligase [Trueperella bialowiezensis]VEI13667.1 Lysylphosphatidylglycerol biosynthesis bifunctional protein LysX [Trueperella bialowiezensis]